MKTSPPADLRHPELLRPESLALGLGQAFLRVQEQYTTELADEDLEPADLALVLNVASSTEWKISLVEMLLTITDDPQRVLQRAIDGGRLKVDDEGRLSAAPRTMSLMRQMLPIVERLNLDWRKQLAERTSDNELATFLNMLQRLGPTPAANVNNANNA